MHKAFANFIFSVVVTAVMNGIDMLYHLATGWAVHLNYVAIKITLIFLTVWMISQFIGIGKEEGIAASLFGPLMFYIYYVFAGATLNREEFRLDEQFWFIFLHIGCMLIAYFGAWYYIKGKAHAARNIGFWITASFTAIALFALVVMIEWRMQGITEEDAARMMNFSLIIIPALMIAIGIAVGLLLDHFAQRAYIDSIGAAGIAGIGIGLLTGQWLFAAYGIALTLLTYVLIHAYSNGLAEANHA